ncbi:MAG: BatD family protein [Flavisolibacter sp.]
MKAIVTAILLLFIQQLSAQNMQIILPTKPVTVGTAFLVQYVITDPAELVSLDAPLFEGLQIVSGPNQYKGNVVIDGKSQPIQNVTYTLIAFKTGTIKIAGLVARFKNGIVQKTADGMINVLPQPKASYLSASSYTDISLFAPSSKKGMEELIDENLFIRMDVDRTSCLVGEPIVATYTLYSRVQASSEVVNAPSLYGFSVMDMLDVNESHQEVKTLGNKVFNTSVLRKLQLYPQQTGKLVVDEMQLQNEIEFDDPMTPGTNTKLERVLFSRPVTILVKPLPAGKPSNFGGAVGEFSIEAELEKNTISADQPGKMIVTIRGKGNFIQFTPPLVNWPKGFDVFDPAFSDSLNKNNVPVTGSRSYVFNFVNDSAGNYNIDPVSFSYFDPHTSTYKSISTKPVGLKILPAKITIAKQNKLAARARKFNFLWILIAATVIAGMSWLYLRKSKKLTRQLMVNNRTDYLEELIGLEMNNLSDKKACLEIQKIARKARKDLPLSTKHRNEFELIDKDCELLAYSDIADEYKKEELKLRLIRLLQELENGDA